MRDFSKVNPSVWSSKRFTSLDDDGKLFYLYALTSPQSNSCGCYRLPIGYIMEDLGWEKDRILYGIETVSKSGLVQYDFTENVIFVDRWYEFNAPNNPKHCLKVIAELSVLPSSHLKTLSANELRDFVNTKDWDKKNVLSKLEPLTDDTVSHTVSRLGDTETETETETDISVSKETSCSDCSYTTKDGRFMTWGQVVKMLWDLYPSVGRAKRGQAQFEAELKKHFNKEGKNVEQWTELIGRIGTRIAEYRRYCEATGEKQPDPWRWIKNKGFDDTYDFKPSQNQRGSRSTNSRTGNPTDALNIALADKSRVPQLPTDF